MKFILKLVLGLGLFLPCLHCTSSPRGSPSDAAASVAFNESHAPPVASSGSPEPSVTPPPSATIPGNVSQVGTGSEPRVTTHWPDRTPWYLMQFPTSISEQSDRVAALVSVDNNGDIFQPQWLVLKMRKTDKVERIIPLVDLELASKLATSCREGPSSCIYKDEVDQRIRAANALLDRYRWRALPCYRELRTDGETRFGPGCDRFRDLAVLYEDPWLLISLHGRVLLNQRRPTWGYRGQSCKKYMDTCAESIAFDPETGVFIVGIFFWATIEGCDVPLWDFHPIRVPMLEEKTLPGLDGGAP
jgi:hypothetical protein